MTAQLPESARHEVKFISSPERYHEIEHWVRIHRAGFRSPYPPRRVNNVYFDDPVLYAYEENLVGASARSKVRLRWYGETFQPDSCVLEVKQKRNMLGWKRSFRTGPVDFMDTSWRDIRQKLRVDLPVEARAWLDENPQPVLLNRYDRQYFVSHDGKVRLTLDANQQVYDQRLRARPNLTRRANLPQTVVVEFKFGPDDHRAGSHAIQGIPIRVSRNSKYVIGVQSLLRG